MKILLKEKIAKTNAITLISLVVTIIVLIILAGVSIYMFLQSDGISEKAKFAKESYANSEAQERSDIDSLANLIETSPTEDIPTATQIGFTPEDPNWDVSTIQEALDYLYEN